MLGNISASADSMPQWLHPNEVLKIQRLKLKKKQLQARINKSTTSAEEHAVQKDYVPTVKRKNPFIRTQENKKSKVSNCLEESSDQTLFKLLNFTNASQNLSRPTSFSNILALNESPEVDCHPLDNNKKWIPIDWCLKYKMRLISSKPFLWNQKLKISEEASGITAFVRCLGNHCETTLDTSPNAKFHQCCLYWQHPHFPWLNLFPRTATKASAGTSFASTASIRDSLQKTWSDSLRSLFQLVRTRQCPYFYLCAHNFTVLFRSAGISGYTEMNALISPTTNGLRTLLKQEDIEFNMPLKTNLSDGKEFPDTTETNDLNEEPSDEAWLQSMGFNADDIRQINYTQAKIVQKNECTIDNSEQSLVLIRGMEVHGLYNFLINSKYVTGTTGPLAGIPPTLLAPVAFQGATLTALKVKESKVHCENSDYFSLEISGPILPQVIHNLCDLHPEDQDLTAIFANFNSTLAFSKVKISDQFEKENENASGFVVFGQENLSDCGLNPSVLRYFCSPNLELMVNTESLKYNVETKTYTWT